MIVEAAPQPEGHLFLATDDCLVSVVGTIFSVNHGTKGSRVSVIEGEVWVDQGQGTTTLHPGDQLATHESVGRVALADEVAWSANHEKYRQVMAELDVIAREVVDATTEPPLSPASRVLSVVPGDTVVYSAFPNVSDSLARAHEILIRRVSESRVLRPWWEENVGEHSEQVAAAIAEIRDLGSFFGREVVIVFGADNGAPVILAELNDPAGFKAYLEDRLVRLQGEHGDIRMALNFLEEGWNSGAGAAVSESGMDDALNIITEAGIFAASPDVTRLSEIAAAVEVGRGSFVGQPFHQRLVDSYGHQVHWLFAADLARIGDRLAEDDTAAGVLRAAGVLDAEMLVVESRDGRAGPESRATLSFSSARRGIASWLAAPAPMGTLDFFSPQARLVTAAVVKDPRLMLDDILRISQIGQDRQFQREGSEVLYRIREDLAAQLGGEIALALDGPLLPIPAWKAVIEVYDPVRLQSGVEWLVAEANREAGDRLVSLEPEQVNGQTFYRFTSEGDTTLHYVYTDGYVVLSSQRALLEQALALRDAGNSLAGSRRFQDLLPADVHTNFSAIFYQDMGSLLAPIAQQLRATSPQVTVGGSIGSLPSEPSLAYAYGGDDEIVFAADHSVVGLGADLGTIVGLVGVLGAGL